MKTDYASYGENELLRLLSTGDMNAFELIYERYWERLYDTAFRVLRDRDVSKDIVQDIFIWLWEKRANLSINTLEHYLKAAVKFKVANQIRNGNIRAGFFEEVTRFQKSSELPTPEEQTEVHELARVIHDAIEQLPEKCREIYLLKREHHLTNPEISERLHVSIKTVENQITIAQARIRAAMKPCLLVIVASVIEMQK